MREQIAKSVFWVAWSRVVMQGVTFLSTLVVARLLSPADYGLMALAGIWIYVITLLAELGLGPAIVQFPDIDDSELNACFWTAFALACGAYAILWMTSPWIAAWFDAPALTPVLRVGALALPLSAARLVPDSLLRKRLQLDRIAKGEIIASCITVPVVLGMAAAGAGVWALVAASLSTHTVMAIVTFYFVRWTPGLRIHSSRMNAILRYSVATLGMRLTWAVYQQLDPLILGKVSGQLALGPYSMAKSLALLPSEKVSTLVNQLSTPVLAGLQRDSSAQRSAYLRTLRLTAVLTVPLCIGGALVADDLVYAALGPKWIDAIPLLPVLFAYGLVRSLDVLFEPVLLSRYRAGFLFRWVLSLALIMPIAYWGGARLARATGVASALILVYPALMLVMAGAALSELKISVLELFRELRPVVMAASMLVVTVLVVRGLMPATDVIERAMRMGTCVLAGSCVYIAAIWWRGKAVVDEVTAVGGWLVRRRAAAKSEDGKQSCAA